jgi:hypothetical protein
MCYICIERGPIATPCRDCSREFQFRRGSNSIAPPGKDVLGGSDCFNFSTFSESFKTKVYKCRWQRTLNFVCDDFLLRFMRAAVSSSVSLLDMPHSLIQCPIPPPSSSQFLRNSSPEVKRTGSILASANLNELFIFPVSFHSLNQSSSVGQIRVSIGQTHVLDV